MVSTPEQLQRNLQSNSFHPQVLTEEPVGTEDVGEFFEILANALLWKSCRMKFRVWQSGWHENQANEVF
ncbi:unnamed protein product [Calypogeia fissa]